MNHKQKLRYMALGAGILALGIIIGQFVTPDIEAQLNGVFDKIQCREIEVMDKNGETAIRLYTTKHGGDIRMDSKDGRIATMSINERGGWLYLSGKGRGSGGTASIYTYEEGASLGVDGKRGSVSMLAFESYGSIEVEVEDEVMGNRSAIVRMATSERGGNVWVSGKGGSAGMGTDEHGGIVELANNQGKARAVMGVNEYGNGAVSTWGKNGYRQ